MQRNQGLARQCPSGHDNPAGLAYCGTCGASLSETSQGSLPPAWTSWAGPAKAWKFRREVQLALLAVVAVVLLTGGLAARNLHVGTKLGLLAERHTISGTVTVVDFSNVGRIDSPDAVATAQARLNALQALKAGQTFPCPDGTGGGFDDIRTGTQVTVNDASGKVIGTAGLVGGTMDATGCHFSFAVPSIPKSDFYKVEVSHRGALTYSYPELQQRNWTVETKLD
jgi:hypothetical protein